MVITMIDECYECGLPVIQASCIKIIPSGIEELPSKITCIDTEDNKEWTILAHDISMELIDSIEIKGSEMIINDNHPRRIYFDFRNLEEMQEKLGIEQFNKREIRERKIQIDSDYRDFGSE